MRAHHGLFSVLALVLLASRPADAQAQAAPPDARPFFVGVFAGADFTPANGLVGVEFGQTITPTWRASVHFTYFDNLMTEKLVDELDALGHTLTAQTTAAWGFSGRDRGMAFMGGATYVSRSHSSVQPYIGGGAGAINILRTITERGLGEVRLAVFNDYGIGDAKLAAEDQTRPLVELTAGIIFRPTNHVHVDVGYRLRRTIGFEEDITFSQASVGVGIKLP